MTLVTHGVKLLSDLWQMEFLQQSWPWYVAGPAIALVMAMLLYLGGAFGVSGNLRTICAIGGGGRFSEFFRFNWRAQIWNLVFIGGAVLGGLLASNFMQSAEPVALSQSAQSALAAIGFQAPVEGELLPPEIFDLNSKASPNLFLLIIAGFLVGFGTRYAGGCTSGHAISGLSDLQLPSLIAVFGFFAGGLLMTHLLFPLIFN